MRKWPAQLSSVVTNVGRELSLLKMAIDMANADYMFFLWNELEPRCQQPIPTNDTPYLVPYSRYVVSFVSIWDKHYCIIRRFDCNLKKKEIELDAKHRKYAPFRHLHRGVLQIIPREAKYDTSFTKSKGRHNEENQQSITKIKSVMKVVRIHQHLVQQISLSWLTWSARGMSVQETCTKTNSSSLFRFYLAFLVPCWRIPQFAHQSKNNMCIGPKSQHPASHTGRAGQPKPEKRRRAYVFSDKINVSLENSILRFRWFRASSF